MDINTARSWLQNEIDSRQLRTEILTVTGRHYGEHLMFHLGTDTCQFEFILHLPYGSSIATDGFTMSDHHEIIDIVWYLELLKDIGRKWDRFCDEQRNS